MGVGQLAPLFSKPSISKSPEGEKFKKIFQIYLMNNTKQTIWERVKYDYTVMVIEMRLWDKETLQKRCIFTFYH